MRATSETVAPGSNDAATSRSFSSCDHRRRRSTDVITSAREIVIALLLGLPLGPAALASVKQGGPQWRDTLYSATGYSTSLTPRQKDGGYDLLAVKEDLGQRSKTYIECKKWETNVGVKIVRQLLGVVSDRKATGGVCVMTSDLTETAKIFVAGNPRLHFVSGAELVRLMNEYLGPNWFYRIERLVAESKKSCREPDVCPGPKGIRSLYLSRSVVSARVGWLLFSLAERDDLSGQISDGLLVKLSPNSGERQAHRLRWDEAQLGTKLREE
ncbi:hypothetical protein ACVILL_006070 [Bradyrhizobium sp. USDA 3364]